jgi:hypothetical protein
MDRATTEQRSMAANDVKCFSYNAIKLLQLAAEERGLDSSKILEADHVVRSRIVAAVECYKPSDPTLGYVFPSSVRLNFLGLRFPKNTELTDGERAVFIEGVKELDRLELRLQLEDSRDQIESESGAESTETPPPTLSTITTAAAPGSDADGETAGTRDDSAVVYSDAEARRRTKRSTRPRLAEAMLLVRDHPDWTDRKIAKEVNLNPGTLSRDETYQRAAQIARASKAGKSRSRRGHVKIDDETGRADVEAYEQPDAD